MFGVDVSLVGGGHDRRSVVNYERRRVRWATFGYFTLLAGMFVPLLLRPFLSRGLVHGIEAVVCLVCLVVAWFCVTVSGWSKTRFGSNPKFFFWIWGGLCALSVWVGFWDVFIPWATSTPPWVVGLR